MSDIPMTVTVSLRARARTGDLRPLADALALPVVRAWQAEEPRSTPTGTVLPGVNADSYISLKLYPTQRVWLSEALNECLSVLEPHRAHLNELRSNGVSLELFVGWFLDRSGGDSLQPEIMQRLADLGISVSLDVYPSETYPNQVIT